MSFKRVVVLGGGPVGLLCAIEAKQHFPEVAVVEKRSAYTRLNSPVIDTDLRKHFKKLGVHEAMGFGKSGGEGAAPLRLIESTLLNHATTQGVKILRPYVVSGVAGGSENKYGRYKSVLLTLGKWDDKAKKLDANGDQRTLKADLLVVASGGGAAADPIITDALGFTYEKLKAKNYGAYGAFQTGVGHAPSEDLDTAKIVKLRDETVKYTIFFKVTDYDYLLTNLSGLTKADFKQLQASEATIKRLIISLNATKRSGWTQDLMDAEKSVAVFKIAIQRARQFYSPKYPAVLVGDAAVTPHPDQGSGYTTGFRGFEELKALLGALRQTDREKDNNLVFQGFNDRYELHVSRKAVEGTVGILSTNKKMMQTFRDDMRRFQSQVKDRTLWNAYGHDAEIADQLANEFEVAELLARKYEAYLKPDQGQPLPNLNWDETVGALWKMVGVAWKKLKALTEDKTMIEGRLEELAGLLKVQ